MAREKFRLGFNEYAMIRYAEMTRHNFGRPNDELRVFLKSMPASAAGPAMPREVVKVLGTDKINEAIAEITDAIDPDEPDYVWQNFGFTGMPRRN